MADTDKLRPYLPASPPQLGGDQRYLQKELQKVSSSLSTAGDVAKSVETRVAANEAAITTLNGEVATLNTEVAAPTTGLIAKVAANTTALGVLANNPCFETILATSYVAAVPNDWNKVIFPSPSIDIYGGWDATNKRFKPPAGVYMILFNMEINTANGSYGALGLQKNGGFVEFAHYQVNLDGGDTTQIAHGTHVSHFSGTDYVDVMVMPSGAGGAFVYSNWTFMRAVRLA
jgi:hypothetical protein